MIEYHLKPSLNLLSINICLYLLSATALLVHYQINLISLMLFLLIILFAANDVLHYRKKIEQPAEILSLNLSSGLIGCRLNDDYRQFTEYSVYTCRWGMILVLKQSGFRRHITLLADRFKFIHEYLDIRYQLIRLNQVVHAS